MLRPRLVAFCLALLVVPALALAHGKAAPRPAGATLHAASGLPLPAGDRLSLLDESFEGAWPPAGWSLMTSGAATPWEQTSIDANNGVWSARVHYGPQGAAQDEWLVTPAIDLSAATQPSLEFAEAEEYWADYGQTHSVLVSTTVPDNPAAFTAVAVWTPGNHSIPATFDGSLVSVDLSAYAGQGTVYLAFRYEGTWADDWYVDDVRVFEPSDHDMAAIALTPDGEQFTGGDAVTPRATVANVGLNPETANVTVEIFEGNSSVYLETMPVGPLAPGEEITVDFPSLTLNSGETYLGLLAASFTGDEDPSNNTASSTFNTWTDPHVPMLFLFTNSGCAPCVQANQAMDAYLPTVGDDVALMRIHAWWPFPGDIMWLANEPQNEPLINGYGVSGVPNFWLDGVTDLATSGVGAQAAAETSRQTFSPMTVTPHAWDSAGEILTIRVHVSTVLPPGQYRLFWNVTEDGIEHNGGNGEPVHNQAFLYQYPDLDGLSFPAVVGDHEFNVPMPLNPDGNALPWTESDLRATCYVQNVSTREILQAGTAFLHDIADLTAVDGDAPAASRLERAWPNPFNPKTTLRYTLAEAGPVQLSVFDLQGRHVADLFAGTQSAGSHEVSWDAGDLGSGVYFVRLTGKNVSESQKVVLTK